MIIQPAGILKLLQELLAQHLAREYGYYVVIFPYRQPGEEPDTMGSYSVLSSTSDAQSLAKLLDHCAEAVRKNLDAAVVEAIREKEEIN